MLTALRVKMQGSEHIKLKQMKKITCLLLTVIAIVLMGCSRDNDDIIVSSQQLSQTIWEGSRVSYDSEGNPHDKTTFILEFISDTEGKCAIQNSSTKAFAFQYAIEKTILSFKGKYPVSGEWYITDSSKDKITLLSYRSDKTIITLNRIN